MYFLARKENLLNLILVKKYFFIWHFYKIFFSHKNTISVEFQFNLQKLGTEVMTLRL